VGNSCGLESSAAYIEFFVLALVNIIFYMKFVLSSQTPHPCMLRLFAVHHWNKMKFEHKHNPSIDCNVHLFFTAKLNGGKRGGGAVLHRLKEVDMYI
jgi:hypothetical protein